MSTTPTILDRVLASAQAHRPAFSVMDVLFDINKQHPYPMCDLNQVRHALEHLARAGHFERVAADRYKFPC